ncbi:MAG: hypothetical protein CVU41_07565 [Chloroflexi bacterium HGW-Chloroflexi-3]|nr:MAG: hypothetical protein CVU41_07565 [Chloroflexi bacterium HGW-Chloroflexi-3]
MGKELSKQTRQNWQINAFLFLSAILASLSGIYFLYFPEGFMGGRNPLYNVTVIFNRTTWDVIHTWSGVGMIAIATLHIIIHWKWVTKVTRRYFSNEKRVVNPVISREQPVIVQTETQQ